MKFDKNSDTTLVITSCGRFDLLKQTLNSFDLHNTYPIKEVIFTEDSGKEEITNAIPEHWLPHSRIIINKKKLGQIKSIDLAYEDITTEYIFHCEDDWMFYRNNFIEESKVILQHDANILQVWLRDYDEDIKKNYPFHYPIQKYYLKEILYYKLGSNNEDWKGFSFNPGLKRKSDYDAIKPYFCNKDGARTESYLSNIYFKKNMFAVFLEKSAVKHIGWEQHILSEKELRQKRKKNKKKFIQISIGFIVGFIVCYFITN